MRHLIIPLFALLACTAWTDVETEQPDLDDGGETPGPAVLDHCSDARTETCRDGGSDSSTGRLDVGERLPTTQTQPLLPYGIGPTDPYAQDPNAHRACADAARELATWHQRRGVEAYCKRRSWYARRGAKEPKRWVDGSYLHAVDIKAARAMWTRAYRAGWIDPEACPMHSMDHALQMFTRGKWFDLSLYNARHLVTTRTIPCWDPAIMDRTDVGARVVVTRSIKACYKHYKSPCTESNLRRWWKEWIP